MVELYQLLLALRLEFCESSKVARLLKQYFVQLQPESPPSQILSQQVVKRNGNSDSLRVRSVVGYTIHATYSENHAGQAIHDISAVMRRVRGTLEDGKRLPKRHLFALVYVQR